MLTTLLIEGKHDMRKMMALLLALAMALAACGGGETAPPGDDDSSTGASTTAPNEDTLEGFFGWGGDSEAQQMDWRNQEARIQESIRVCMAEQGFEYLPVLSPEDSFVVYEEGSEDEEERIRREGFGITTWYGELGEEIQGFYTTDTTMGGEEWSDPNQERLEAMSESERKAWEEALWGTPDEQEAAWAPTIDEETGDTIYEGMGFGPGCQGEAQEAEYGDMEETSGLWEELNPAFEAMYEQVQADPRIVEANQNWSACMAAAGHQFESRDKMWETMYEDFQSRLDEIVGLMAGTSTPWRVGPRRR